MLFCLYCNAYLLCRFHQILLNIVSNAVKFTWNGYVSVDIACSERTNTRCKLAVSIEDSGIGIPEKACAKVFEPFAQADDTTTRRYNGTGLGLTVCKQLVDLMGGMKSVVLFELSLFGLQKLKLFVRRYQILQYRAHRNTFPVYFQF